VLAEAYIVFIVFVIDFIQHQILRQQPEGTILIPMLMLSVFVLSAAIMGFLFLAQPIQLYLDGKKKEAVHLFLYTTAAFAAITILVLSIFLITR
jgi:heme O synthase-like polyprenyltransferase